MRIIFLSFFLCLSHLILQAQQKTVQYIGWKSSYIELHTLSNNKRTCTFILGKDSVKAFLVNNKAVAAELFTIPRAFEEKFLGGFIKGGNIYLFMDNALKPGLHSWCYNIDSKVIIENVVPFELKNEKIINRISSNNHFFYFTLNKKTSEFIIYKFNNERYYDTTRYPFDPEVWDDLKSIKRELVFGKRKISIERADMEGECDIKIAQNSKKLYVHNDTLFLLLNNVKNVTTVYAFDLINNKMDHRIILHKNDDSLSDPFVYNSFLLRNNLYYASASNNNLFLQIVDFYTGNILKEFKANRNEEISFKNSSITQQGDAIGTGNVRELGKTKQLLRKLTNGSLVITATPNDLKNEVELLVGSYKEVTNYGGGGGMWMAGGGTAAPIFMPTGGFSRSSWSKSASFKVLINAENYEHINGMISPSINDRVNDFTKGIKIPPEGENLFVIDGKYYYAYYDKNKRDFTVAQL
jgi:hypothetical protein